MTKPSTFDQVPLVETEDGLHFEEPVPPAPRLYPAVEQRFRKLLEFAMPLHAITEFGPGTTTAETIAASIDSLLANYTLGQITEFVWNSIEEYYEHLEQEIPQ